MIQIDNGFITLHRQLLTWQWYTNVNTKTLFIHCLLRANHKDTIWQLVDIKRGQFITSIKSLSNETGLSERQVRSAMDKLKLTSELTSKATNKYSIVTVLKYNDYQTIDKQKDKQVANKRQTNDKQLTTDNNNNNVNNETIIKKSKQKKHFDNVKLNDLFNDFLKQRLTMKAKNTDRAITLLLNTLKPFDDNIKIEMINNSIMNSWKSVFPLKNGFNNKKELANDIKSDWLDDYIKEL